MKRREFVRSALAITLAPTVVTAQMSAPVSTAGKVVSPGPLPWMLGLNHFDDFPLPYFDVERIGVNETHLFTSVQMQTLVHLSEILMPPMAGHPGAVEALTPDFLDFFIAHSVVEMKVLYQSGLDRLEAKAQQSYHKSFASLEAQQVDTLIRPLLTPWAKDHLPKDPDKRFLNRAHYDIRMATRNSGAWALAQVRLGHSAPEGHLYWFPVEPDIAFRDKPQPAGTSGPV